MREGIRDRIEGKGNRKYHRKKKGEKKKDERGKRKRKKTGFNMC